MLEEIARKREGLGKRKKGGKVYRRKSSTRNEAQPKTPSSEQADDYTAGTETDSDAEEMNTDEYEEDDEYDSDDDGTANVTGGQSVAKDNADVELDTIVENAGHIAKALLEGPLPKDDSGTTDTATAGEAQQTNINDMPGVGKGSDGQCEAGDDAGQPIPEDVIDNTTSNPNNVHHVMFAAAVVGAVVAYRLLVKGLR